ncbi:hypothetical protein Osc7112_5167 [Oscillatoria nigro-viridis PCC 7112]|uniref:Uncharacterized protein n=1 Tax=Phormidium nigroviride PCC 7112 TaxID=179408 RepID=K9VN85_9CYAN|nr:hypothetical protein Osc7112_5167 [Oscillatoria nigro-viridis PCC 7112]
MIIISLQNYWLSRGGTQRKKYLPMSQDCFFADLPAIPLVKSPIFPAAIGSGFTYRTLLYEYYYLLLSPLAVGIYPSLY